MQRLVYGALHLKPNLLLELRYYRPFETIGHAEAICLETSLEFRFPNFRLKLAGNRDGYAPQIALTLQVSGIGFAHGYSGCAMCTRLRTQDAYPNCGKKASSSATSKR